MTLADVSSTREIFIEILKAYGLMVITVALVALVIHASRRD